MDVKIVYCRACGYQFRAVSLAEAIKKDLAIEPKLTPGEAGQFSIYANGKLIAERKNGVLARVFGGWPKEAQVVEELRKLR